MAVVVRQCHDLESFFNRLVERDNADLMIEFVNHRDLARLLEYLEWVGRGQHARYSIGHAKFSGLIDDRPILQPRYVLVVGSLAGRCQKQTATAEKLNPGVIPGRPIDARKIWK